MKKQKLNFHFHDPDPPGVAADAILRILVEANMGKLEKATREAAEQKKSVPPKKPKSANLRTVRAETALFPCPFIDRTV